MEKGSEETSMDDIAERADVARTSVFNYFSPKTASS
jgi:AcrR family transcriptional regulator